MRSISEDASKIHRELVPTVPLQLSVPRPLSFTDVVIDEPVAADVGALKRQSSVMFT